MENGHKEVDNTEGIFSTNSVSITELIQIETSIHNSFGRFQFRKIFPKWNGTIKIRKLKSN